jgi:hypothetical protein
MEGVEHMGEYVYKITQAKLGASQSDKGEKGQDGGLRGGSGDVMEVEGLRSPDEEEISQED